MKDIHIFFNTLKANGGATWLEDENIKLAVPKNLQNKETKDFVTNSRSKIISILRENNIYSKESFLGQTILRNNSKDEFPLSFGQERLWFIEEYESGTNAYHVPSVFELEKGTDKRGIKYAIVQIVSRHEVLRSTISSGENQTGIQVVHDKSLKIDEVCLKEKDFETTLNEDINRPFTLSEEYPIRVKLYTVICRQNTSKEILLINLHHIASDGWSEEIFQEELVAYYEAYVSGNTSFRLPELEIQYKDYAAWQRSYLTGDLLSKQLSYWKQKLSGYENLALPTDYSRPGKVDYRGSSQVFILSKATSEKLRTLAKEKATTLHTVLLSSVSILLGKYSGTEDIITGSPIANRHHWQTEKLIGFFVNSQVNRVVLRQGQSFESLIEATHQDQVLSQSHQDLPFEKLIDELGVERDPSRHPIFQVMFDVQGFGKSESVAIAKKGNYLSAYEGSSGYEVSKFDVSISFNDSQEELIGYIGYATSLFKEETITRLVGYYQSLIERLVQEPQRAYSELSLVEAEEYQKLIYDWNKTDKEYPKDKTIQALFEEQAARTPDNIALVYEGEQLTYKELNEKSNQVARHIRNQYKQQTGEELKSDTLIALLMDRSLEMVVGILGVLKAGGAYVPIAPDYPRERIEYMLADTKVDLLLSQRLIINNSHAHLHKSKVVCIDLNEQLYTDYPKTNLPKTSTARQLAYVIYTSGTTGKPNGVMIEHTSLINLLQDLQGKYTIEPSERFLLFASYVFDASCEQMFLSLLSGATLFVINNNTIIDSSRFINFIVTNKITHVHATPSYLNSIDPAKLSTLKRVVFGAEYLSQDVFLRYKQNVPTVINEYGPTETTVTSHVSINSFLLNSTKLQNVKTYVLDGNRVPVPVGVIGELHIGGAGLARGYLNNEILTKERFINNPFASEADKENGYTRLYKTGDLVRWLADGSLEYLGRNDEQVKIRGYRIELGEIEHALQQVPGIKQSCVLARERETTAGKSKCLVGYYVVEQGTVEVTESVILNHLSTVLPEYMVPSALVALESFPLTINGKLDKRALPDPDFSNKESYVAPVTEAEKNLSKIWSEVLGVERVGIEDNFFRTGGNSILAIQASHRMSKALEVTVSIADIFKYKTISEILRQKGSFSEVTIPKVKGETAVLSFAQERLWFIEEYEEGTNAYHIPLIFALEKTTDKEGIKYAIGQIVSRHEVLRSTISRGDDQKGIQKVHAEPLKIEEVVVEEGDFEEALSEDINRPFALSKEYPIRVKLYTVICRENTSKEILLINLHHIASDGWSEEIFQEELLVYYEAYISRNTSFRLPELEIQYKDYAAWQRSYLTGDLLSKQLSYWKQKLSGYENLSLPTDYNRPGEFDYKGANQVFILSKATSAKLRTLAKDKATTLHTVLLSSVSILLGKYSGSEDIITGSPIANRHHWQTGKLIGFFVNSQVNRVVLRQGQSFESLIEITHQDQVLSQSYQDLPFEKLIDELDVERDPSRHPIFQVMFGVQGFGKSESVASGKKGNYLSAYEGSSEYEVSKFDVSISFNDTQEELIGYVEYATSLFKEETITRLIGYYQSLIERLVQEPQRAYSELSLVEAEEYQRLIYDWNKTDKEYSKDKTIQVVFEEQAAKTPDNIALAHEGEQLTYKELNEKSNQLARYIRSQYKERMGQELTSDTLIPICLDRSFEMIVGILGVLKAGGAYVPIDPEYPKERIDYLLADTKAELVLTQKHLTREGEVQFPQDKVLHIDLAEPFYRTEEITNLPAYATSKDLAYVIYTSGTTGKPKGVMIEHPGVINLIADQQQKYHAASSDRILLFSNYVFDASVEQMFLALLTGATLVVIDSKSIQDGKSFNDFLEENQVSQIDPTPSYLSSIELSSTKTLRRLIFGGEHLPRQLFDRYRQFVPAIYNTYGPTETTVTCLVSVNSHLLSNARIQNIKVYVLDPNKLPVPIGVIGELYIGGAGVARGYLNNEALTKERFIANPFATESDKQKGYTRLYKTGDLVRWLADGNLEYLGRNDDQVKIRGYRIELGEIEQTMQQIPGVRQSCVLARERETASGKSKYLVGYYVVEQDAKALTSSEMSKQLSTLLPEYMVPSALVALESFPLTINGKLDKRALPDADFSNKESYVAPVTETEKLLSKIWSEVLGVERVGIEDNFFRIGGDSILSIQVSSRIRQLGYTCQVKDIFTHKTISKLSAYLNNNNEKADIQSEQGLLNGAVNLLPIQQWFFEQVSSGQFTQYNHWNQSFLIKVPALAPAKLTVAIKDLVDYHDAFRINYLKAESWHQFYRSTIEMPEIKNLDVSAHTPEEIHELLTEWQREFDVENGALYRIGYLYGYADGSARIYVAMHHLIVDAVSWRIIAEDLKRLYEGKTLPPKGSSYRQWVETVSKYAEQHTNESNYWSDQLKGLPAYAAGVLREASEGQIELSSSLTQRLLQHAPEAYHTEINDLLLTALAYALCELNGEQIQGITLEGHGRELIDVTTDHSHTVGWYTSMYPVRLALGATIGESICKIKEGLRSTPNKGIGFGAFAVRPDTEYNFSDLPPISFNYLGQFGTEKEGDWKIASERSGQTVSSLNKDHNIININGGVFAGKLVFSVVTQLGPAQTEKLSRSFEEHMKAVTDFCISHLSEVGSSYTPSDFSTVKLSQPLINSLQQSARALGNSIVNIYPANSLQQGFIHHALTQQDDDAYRVQQLFDYHHRLDVGKYIEAWQLCIRQYPILRTAFNWEEHPIQVIYKEGDLEYQVHDISSLFDQTQRDEHICEIQQEDRLKEFDLTRPTLLRLHVIKQSEACYTILKSDHHIITDGWSNPILLNSLHRYYQALVSGERVAIKEDTAYLRAQEYIGSHKTKLSSYWSGILSEVDGANDIQSLLSNPIDLSSYKYVEEPKEHLLEVSGLEYDQIKKLSKREGITLSVIVQFMWHKLLQVYSGQTKSVVGTIVSGRDLPVEGIESSVGLYINTLPLVVDWGREGSILSQLHHIQERMMGLNTNSFADLAKLQRGGERLFHSLLICENYPRAEGDDEDRLRIELRDSIEKADYPLNILAYEDGDMLIITLQYDGKYLSEERAAAHIRTMQHILGYVREDVNRPHHQISLLQPDEYQKLIYDWNKTDEEYPKDKTVHELFEEQAARTPDNIALVFEGAQLTYKELNEKSNQLARHIRSQYKERTGQELTADTLIALFMERSLEMVVGILGVLKAGGAYVPIDPTYPRERIDYMLEDTGATLVLSQKNLTAGLEHVADRLLSIDLSKDISNEEDIENLSLKNSPEDLAYVIYTSGTTGKPKGVMVEHHQIVSFAINNNFIDYKEASVIGGISNYVFDGSVFDIFLSLLNGKQLILVSKNDLQDPLRLDIQLLNNGVDTIFITTALFNSLVVNEARCLGKLKQILFGGEACSIEIVNNFKSRYKTASLIHVYGPTENIVYSTYCNLNGYNTAKVAPIGSHLSDKKLHVLDTCLNPVPVGVIGELYIGGAGVARGYLHNDILTKERFIDNPFATEADKEKGYTRLYKTGDLVRWLPDGNLEYLGRNDDQVKIRGYRIELGEIEHALQQIPGVRQSCVLARERETASGKSKYLVGYYVVDQGAKELTSSEIVKQLSTLLPEYMVPSALVALESFPLTINGKIDKRALPDPDFSNKESYVAPVTATERALSKIWSDVLGVERVGVEDNFFRIGGNSILAIQTSHRMSKALEATVSIADIFTCKTIAEILRQKGSFSKVTIPKVKGETAVLSFAQERLWFIEEYEEGTNAYHIPLIFELEKTTDKEGLKYAIRQIVSRHEVLRSTVSRGDDQKGIQKVHAEPLKIEEVVVEEGDFEETLSEDINRPFVLSEEYPIRVILYTLTSAKQASKEILLINLHHIASDGWSLEIFQEELRVYYEAYISGNISFRLPELEIQYKDYAVWQRSYLTGDLLSKQLSYWKQKLSGYENLALPTDYNRPGEVDYKGSGQVFILSKATSAKLRTLAKEKATTLHSVLLSSVSILLGKYSGSEDIITGSPIANRHHWQTGKLIGFFVNSQVNRVVLRHGQSFESLIETTHQDQVLSQSYQDLPFEKLIDELDVERDPSRHPIFQVMFDVQGFGKSEGVAPGKRGNYLSTYEGASEHEVSKFDVSISFNDTQEELIGYIGYATSLFKEETITRLIGYYQSLIERLVQEPQRAYSELSLVGPEEYQKLVYDWNKTDKEYPKDKTIQALFEEQAARTPDNIALVNEGEQLTYKELNEKSNQLARHILSQYKQRTGKELRADTLIGLYLDRSLEMVVGILGVLKAGGAYVPMDTNYPRDRIDYMLFDTQTELVLSQRQLKGEEKLPSEKVLAIDLSEDFYKKEESTNLSYRSISTDLAYVIYTSGTTGKPKGVMVEHRSVSSKSSFYKSLYGVSSDQVSLFYRSYAFDGAIEEYLIPLLHGAKSIIYSPRHFDLIQIQRLIREHQVTKVNVSPQLLYSLIAQEDSIIDYIKILVLGGDKLDFSVFDQHRFTCAVYNTYGPTESTIDSHIFRIAMEGDRLNNYKSCIGKNVFDSKSYVLDANLNPVPVGVIGELYIGGAGLARGYLNNETLTNERFIPNPFANESDRANGYTRLYKTGDLVRWLSDGNLEYLRRNDDQVKIRGYRIELGEIEHALQQVPGVRQSCVLARERETASGKSKYLVGYYVVDHGAKELTSSEIVKQLSTLLPEYMVPSAWLALESFPLTINGKLDKRALPDPDFTDKESYVAPTTETEKALSKIWSEVLGVERVGIEDNFFRIGGDSILSIQVSSRIRQLGYICQVKDIFTHKTISKLSAYLDSNNEKVDIQSEQGLLNGAINLLPIQQWFFEQVNIRQFAEYNHWNHSFLIKVPTLNQAKLTAIIKDLVDYHDAFRINFIKAENWHQFYRSTIEMPEIKNLDVRGHTPDEIHQLLTDWQGGFDLEKGALYQVGYLYGYEDGSARIFVAMHHLIVDAVSWRIITEDLKRLYEGKALPSKGSSYRQWVEVIARYPEQHAAESRYWSEQLEGLPVYIAGELHKPSGGQVELSEQLTQQFLQEASGAYHTEINDLLLTALAYALSELNGQYVQGITLEGHGREPIDATIDHSHTVGWYTSMYPVRLALGTTIGESISKIKEGLRSIPNKGIGFGAFAVSKETEYGFSDLPPVTFNYLGRFGIEKEVNWQIAPEDSGASTSYLNQDCDVIKINGEVSEGKLVFSVVTKLGAFQTEKLSRSFEAHLKTVTEYCLAQLSEKGSSYTPSDFSTVKISQSLLDKLQFETENENEE